MIDLTSSRATYQSLASLLEYPSDNYLKKVEKCLEELNCAYPNARVFVADFYKQISSVSIETLEEIYTRTFDVAPICVPYVTSYIFGAESFERGELMSKLLDIYKRYEFDAERELPDHLGVLLKFAACLSADELKDLVEFCLHRPVSEMAELLKSADNPFYPVLSAIKSVLIADFPEDKEHD